MSFVGIFINMHKLKFQEVQKRINKKFNDIILINYISYNNIVVRSKYGLSSISLGNLLSCNYPNLKSAINKTLFFKNMFYEKFPKSTIKIVGEFTCSYKPILIEYDDLLFNIKADKLLQGVLPHIKNCTDKNAYSIKEFNKIHNGKYSYPNLDYCGSNCVIKIKCPKHGDFKQKYYVHKMGSSCIKCAEENRVGGYTKTDFIKNAKGRECTLYIIRCWNYEEEFYKIGITMRDLKTRFGERKRMPYNYSLVKNICTTDAGLIYSLEKRLLKKYKLLSYKPNISFHGESECFNINLPIDNINI